MKKIIFILLILIIIITTILYVKEINKNNALEKELSNISENYLRENGYTTLYKKGDSITYDLRSFDGGKIWYACELGDDWELNILGKSEEVYPKLINFLHQRDSIIDGLLGPITE